MNREFKCNDIIRAYGYNHVSNRVLVVQNVNMDGSLYCMDMPKSCFGRRSLYGRPISEFPSVVIEQNNAVKIGYLVERKGLYGYDNDLVRQKYDTARITKIS